MAIILKLNMKTAKRLSYAVGRSDDANAFVQVATQAAQNAEREIRDLVSLVADQQDIQLPPNFGIRFIDDANEIEITTREPMPNSLVELPAGMRTNGKD